MTRVMPGEGVPKDTRQAYDLFLKASEQEDSSAFIFLGVCYYLGEGTTKSEVESARCFRRAAELGDKDAPFLLLSYYGIEYSEDIKKRVESAQDTINRLSFEISDFFPKGKIPSAKLKNALSTYAHNVPRQTILALFDSTVFGKADDGFLLTFAGIYGHNLWDSNIVYFSWNEINSINYDSFNIIINDVSIGTNSSAKRIAMMLLNIQGYFISDSTLSVIGKKQAQAESGNAEAQFFLGKYYDTLNDPHSLSNAAIWYLKAAKQGHAKAQNNLGVCYQYGRGFCKNLPEAIKWYEMAAKQGNPTAMNNLQKVRNFNRNNT